MKGKILTSQSKNSKIKIWEKSIIFLIFSLLLYFQAQCCTVTDVSLRVGSNPDQIDKTTIYVPYSNQPFYVKVSWSSQPGSFEITVKNTATDATIAYGENVERDGEGPYYWTNPAFFQLEPSCFTIKAYVKRKDNQAQGESNTCSVTIFKIDVELNGMDEIQEEEVGLYLPLNNDDDNSDTTIDREQHPVIGENDLSSVIISASPSDLPGTLTLSWGSNIKLWETTNKDTEVTKTTYTASELPKTYYVEGYNPSNSLKDTQITLSYTAPDNTQYQDTAKITVYEVEETGWVEINSALDDNPNPGGGKRIFPCKQTPDDTISRDQVYVKAKVKPAIPYAMVYFHSFDVDDPSSSSIPIDDETCEKDNRGVPQEGILEETQQTTDQNGIAKVRFIVTMQPGDNFRVIASANKDFYKRFKAKQNDLAGRLIDGNNDEVPIENTTPMLTVWRRLHIEVDSMGPVPTTGDERNFITGKITKITGDNIKATTVYVENCLPYCIDDGSKCLPIGNGRFEKGIILIGSDQIGTLNLDGNGRNFIVKGSGINVPFTITKGNISKSGKVKSMNDIGDKILLFDTTITETDFTGGVVNICGNTFFVEYSGVDTCLVDTPVVGWNKPTLPFTLLDDDKIAGDIPMPNTSDLERVLKPAYVVPAFDVGDNNGDVEFNLNIDYVISNEHIIIQDWDSKSYNKNDFWVGYILGAYQGYVVRVEGKGGDVDPNNEGGAFGVTDLTYGGCLIFKEVHLEDCVSHPDAEEQDTVDHEVSHLFGSMDGEDQPMTGGPPGNYTPETINTIRSCTKPAG